VLCFLATISPSAFAANETHVVLTTSVGNTELTLDSEKVPVSTKNFFGYVNSGYYYNTIFHCVIPGFIVQGGGFTADMKQKSTHAPIKNEADCGTGDHDRAVLQDGHDRCVRAE